MDGLDYYNEENNTYCWNFSDYVIQETRAVRIFGILSIPLLLVPTLILQLFFIYRYKSTFLHRQFLYATIVVTLISAKFIVYSNIVDAVCPLLNPLIIVTIFNRYFFNVEIIQIMTIHLLLLYKLCKHMETRTIQRLRAYACCCNIRPRLWHDVIILCVQLGLPIPILKAEFVAILKFETETDELLEVEQNYFINPLLAANILLGLICIVLLVIWFCMLWKRKLLKSKVKFVCTQMGHILLVLVVFFIWNLIFFGSPFFPYNIIVVSAIRTLGPVSFGVYILMSLPSQQRKVTTKSQVPVTNRHTNPPSTRVSLPTDTAEHAPNFLSPSTAENSEVTPLVNNETLL